MRRRCPRGAIPPSRPATPRARARLPASLFLSLFVPQPLCSLASFRVYKVTNTPLLTQESRARRNFILREWYNRAAMKRTLKLQLILRFIAVIWIITIVCSIMGTLLINKGHHGASRGERHSFPQLGKGVSQQSSRELRELLLFRLFEKHYKGRPFRQGSTASGGIPRRHQRKGQVRHPQYHRRKGSCGAQDRQPRGLRRRCVRRRRREKGPLVGCHRLPPSMSFLMSREKEGAEIAARCTDRTHTRGKGLGLGAGPESPALALISASPILRKDNKVAGVLYGGEILNRNDELIDKIRHILYQNEKYRGKDIGVVTLFLKDVRISTNFLNPERRTGPSAPRSRKRFSTKVLKEGKQWVGNALVIHDWYMTGYEPISGESQGRHRRHSCRRSIRAEIRRHAKGGPHDLSRDHPLRRDPLHRRRQLPLQCDRSAYQ